MYWNVNHENWIWRDFNIQINRSWGKYEIKIKKCREKSLAGNQIKFDDGEKEGYISIMFASPG
jgi:hypothetical protein